jgi:hypothetical protein
VAVEVGLPASVQRAVAAVDVIGEWPFADGVASGAVDEAVLRRTAARLPVPLVSGSGGGADGAGLHRVQRRSTAVAEVVGGAALLVRGGGPGLECGGTFRGRFQCARHGLEAKASEKSVRRDS